MPQMCKLLRHLLYPLLLLVVSTSAYANVDQHRQAIMKYLRNIHAQQQYNLEIHSGVKAMLEKMPILKSDQQRIIHSVKRSLPWHTMRILLISSLTKNYSANNLKLAIGSTPSLNADDAKLVNQLIDMTNDTIKRTVDFNIKTAIRNISKQHYDRTNKAALRGDANAQYELGYLYHHGQGVQESYTQAFKWYQKAANQDNYCAQQALAKFYLMGKGTTKSQHCAFTLFQKAYRAASKHLLQLHNKSSMNEMLAYNATVFQLNRFSDAECITKSILSEQQLTMVTKLLSKVKLACHD